MEKELPRPHVIQLRMSDAELASLDAAVQAMKAQEPDKIASRSSVLRFALALVEFVHTEPDNDL